MTIEDQVFNLDETSTVVVTRFKNQPLVWVRWSKDNNPTEWASRLTHYGTFGILVFKRPSCGFEKHMAGVEFSSTKEVFKI